jgi:hypothetical protein
MLLIEIPTRDLTSSNAKPEPKLRIQSGKRHLLNWYENWLEVLNAVEKGR